MYLFIITNLYPMMMLIIYQNKYVIFINIIEEKNIFRKKEICWNNIRKDGKYFMFIQNT